MQKRNQYILKAYLTSRKNRVFLFLLGVFFCFILSISLMVFTSSFIEGVNTSLEQYGEYAFYLDTADSDIYEKLSREDVIKDIVKCECKTREEAEEEHTYVYSFFYENEDRFDMYGFQFIKGTFPKSDKEVIIDMDYMMNHGWDYGIVGEEIEIALSDKEKKTYTVSGVIKKSGAFGDDAQYDYKFIFYKEKPKENCMYVSFKRYDNMKEDLEHIQNKFGVEVYPNWGVYLDLGYINDTTLFEQNQQIYYFIFILILVCAGFVIYNLFKMCIHDQFEKITILNLLGISKLQSLGMFLVYIFRYVIAGSIAGIMISFGFMGVVHRILYGSETYFMQMCGQFPVMQLVKSVGLCFLLMFVVLLPLLLKLWKLSPCALLQAKKSIITVKLRKIQKPVFHQKTRHMCWKMARHYLKNDVAMHILTVIGSAVGTCIVIIGLFYIKINYSDFIGNSKMGYCVQMYEFYSESQGIEEKEELYAKNLGFSKDIVLHSLYEEPQKVQVDKNKLTDAYLNYLYQDNEIKMQSVHWNKDTLDIDATILGLNDIEMEALCKKNNLEDFEGLKEDEAIVLKSMFSVSGNEDVFYHTLAEGDEVTVLFGDNEKEDCKLRIKQLVNELTLYPEYGEYRIIVLVNQQTFEKLYGYSLPMKIFISNEIEKTDFQNTKALENLQIRNDISITYPYQEYLNEVYINRILKIFVYLLSAITVIIAGVLLLSAIYLRVYVNITEYAMLKAVGIPASKIKRMTGYEIGMIFIEGQTIACIMSYFLTKHFYLIKYPVTGTYLYHYPWKSVILALIIVGIILGCVLIPIFRKIDNIVPTKELKSIN